MAATQMFKRPANGADSSNKPRKHDLLGALLVVTMGQYDPEFETRYGTQAMTEFNLLVVDGDHAGYAEQDRREFGNLARQIGDVLQPGDLGVGRYIYGEGNQGRHWYGIEWAQEPAEFEAAEAALTDAV